MTTTESVKKTVGAMAFHHQDGLPAAWLQAMRFAGKDGRCATMPDITSARLATKPGDFPWGMYFTTTTAEYFGVGKDGKLILIVAQGVGPMSTLDGIRKVYSWQYKDQTRGRRGGRITQQEFLDLEAGKFGEVSVIDVAEYCKRYRHPFIETLRVSEALTDPLLKARLGPDTEKYIIAHAEHARAWHRERAGLRPENDLHFPEADFQRFLLRRERQHLESGKVDSDPRIITLDGASNCSYGCPEYGFRKIEEGYALAHLIATGGLVNQQHQQGESLVNDVGCHEWGNGVRLVGIKADGDIRQGLSSGPEVYKLLRKHWPDLLKWTDSTEQIGFRALVKVGEQWFTQYQKQGERMDTCEPEYVVTFCEEVGPPVLFRTTIGGYHGFFRYGIKELEAIAPPGANAYDFVTEPVCECHGGNPTHHTAMVQFYRITADPTKRLVRHDQLVHDFDTLMALVEKEAA